jgi:O-antigen/teichoic acid export membrane protein
MSFIDKKDEASSLFGRILTYYVLSFGTLSLLFFIIAKPLVMIMTQPAFHEAYQSVGLVASGQFLLGIYTILLPGIYFAKEIKYQSLIQFFAAGIAVLLNLWLIPPLGILGAAIAVALSSLAMIIFTQLWNLKRRQEYLKVHHEWLRIGSFGLVYLVYVIVLLWERHLSLLGELVFSIATLLPLPLILYALLSSADRRNIWGMIRLNWIAPTLPVERSKLTD